MASTIAFRRQAVEVESRVKAMAAISMTGPAISTVENFLAATSTMGERMDRTEMNREFKGEHLRAKQIAATVQNARNNQYSPAKLAKASL